MPSYKSIISIVDPITKETVFLQSKDFSDIPHFKDMIAAQLQKAILYYEENKPKIIWIECRDNYLNMINLNTLETVQDFKFTDEELEKSIEHVPIYK